MINAFTDIDWNSYNTSIKFKEGMYTEENVEPTPGKCIIFDIKKMNQKTNQWDDFAWTLLPLFMELETDMDETTKEYYMNSGVFSLPLFKGRVSADLIRHVSESSDPWGRLNTERIPRGILKMDPATLIVKVVDNQREVSFFNLIFSDISIRISNSVLSTTNT